MKTKVKISLIQKIRTSLIYAYINIPGRLRRLRKILFTNWPLDSISYAGQADNRFIENTQVKRGANTSAHNKALIVKRLSKWYVRFIGYPVKVVRHYEFQHESDPFYNTIRGRLFVKKGINIIYLKNTLVSESSLVAFSDNSCLIVIRRSLEDKCLYILHSNFEWAFLDSLTPLETKFLEKHGFLYSKKGKEQRACAI